jgi:polyisoprenoid-binding protein YceI
VPARERTALLFALLLASAAVSAQPTSIDTQRSSVTVRVYKSGLFSGFAHNHIITAPVSAAALDTTQRTASLTFNVVDMKVVDSEGSESDRQEIEATMKGPKVLDSAQFPAISFRSTRVDETSPQHYKVIGELTLHGQSRELSFSVVLTEGIYKGALTLKQTDFGITPVKIAGGTVRVKDEIEISFEIVPR